MAVKKTIGPDGRPVYSLVPDSEQNNSPVISTTGADGRRTYSLNPNYKQPSPTKGAAAPVNASSAQGTSWDRQTTGEKLDSLLAGEHLGGVAVNGGVQMPNGLKNYQTINKDYSDYLMNLGGGNQAQMGQASGAKGLADTLGSMAHGIGYGLERTAAGTLGAAEHVVDALSTPVWWALGKVTSSYPLKPITGQGGEENAVSKFFTKMAEDNLAASPARMYEENIEERYRPGNAQRKIGDIGGAIG